MKPLLKTSHRLRLTKSLSSLTLASALVTACATNGSLARMPPASTGNGAFATLAQSILDDHLRRYPSQATDLGIHSFDSQLEDLSEAAIHKASQAAKTFRARLTQIDPAKLTLDNALDQQLLIHVMDSTALEFDTVRTWQKDPDIYSSAITNAAFVIIKRDYAPAQARLTALIARERQMPETLRQARKNLSQAVPIYTQIALEQIDGNISFFTNDVPSAFPEVKDRALLAQFHQANSEVITALREYKDFLVQHVLPRAKASYAYGADTFAKALSADEMVELPLDQLLAIGEADRQKNERAFQSVAKQIDAHKSAEAVLAALQEDHPPPEKLLASTQQALDSIRQFILDHHIVTIPASDPVEVKETPSFLRATTSASMDTPGPFETAAVRAFYNMTLPDLRDSAADQEDFMRQWYNAAIVNTSVHEAYPGHYIQFLYAKHLPSDVRKVFGASSNFEGWAHYCEQMMLDEGFHADDPSFRLAQLQDALLRDVRLIVGIKLHTQGMTLEEATRLFEVQAHQPHPVALQEAKRGTNDALYGYYTLGKLMILKLRDDYSAKLGAAYTLQGFHDALMGVGPMPMPLVRRALLGEEGSLL